MYADFLGFFYEDVYFFKIGRGKIIKKCEKNLTVHTDSIILLPQ